MQEIGQTINVRCTESQRPNTRDYYFGLMNQKTYAAKAELKRQLAQANQIHLVGNTPEQDWEKTLSEVLQ